MTRLEFEMIPQRRTVESKGRPGNRRSWLVAAALPLTLILTSCGATPPLRIATAGTPNRVAATQVKEAACGTDEQRTGGDNSMPQQYTEQPAMRIDPAKTYSASLETNKGTFQVVFYPGAAPVTVNTFMCL